MIKNVILKKISFIFIWMLQLLICFCSFYAFSSTINMFPWYEPLTMGAFFILVYLVPIQIIIIFVGLLNKKFNGIPPFINLALIVSISIISIINDDFFYKLAAFYTVIESLIIVFWICSASNQLKKT